jgi:hypothetical protein
VTVYLLQIMKTDTLLLVSIILFCAIFTLHIDSCDTYNASLPWVVFNKVQLDSNHCTVYFIDAKDNVDSFVGECDSFQIDQIIQK